MFETKPVRITELAKETEQYLLQKGCKKSTLGVYKATWHKFMAFSSSDVYSRTAAEVFLKLYFGVDVNQMIISKNPQFTGISARQQLEFTTHLLLTD